ncbi:hypothetical protein AOLI_G00103240 [Acnodon oligacanthus]
MDLDIVASNDDLFGVIQHSSSQGNARPAPRLRSVVAVPDTPAASASSSSSSRCDGSRSARSSSRRSPPDPPPTPSRSPHKRRDHEEPRTPTAPALPRPSCSKSGPPSISDWNVAKLQKVLRDRRIPFARAAPKAALFSLYVASLGGRRRLSPTAPARPDRITLLTAAARDAVADSPGASWMQVPPSAGCPGPAPGHLASVAAPADPAIAPVSCLASSPVAGIAGSAAAPPHRLLFFPPHRPSCSPAWRCPSGAGWLPFPPLGPCRLFRGVWFLRLL